MLVKAEFFDKNYVFNPKASLTISVKNSVSNETKTFPLILNHTNYQVDLSSLVPSEYTFTVTATNENISKSGSFKILEYDVEQQFLNADVAKLQQLAANGEGKSYFISNTSRLETDLLNDPRFVNIQKSATNSLPLIDWYYLLIIIAISLALEWFLRKYNGRI